MLDFKLKQGNNVAVLSYVQAVRLINKEEFTEEDQKTSGIFFMDEDESRFYVNVSHAGDIYFLTRSKSFMLTPSVNILITKLLEYIESVKSTLPQMFGHLKVDWGYQTIHDTKNDEIMAVFRMCYGNEPSIDLYPSYAERYMINLEEVNLLSKILTEYEKRMLP